MNICPCQSHTPVCALCATSWAEKHKKKKKGDITLLPACQSLHVWIKQLVRRWISSLPQDKRESKQLILGEKGNTQRHKCTTKVVPRVAGLRVCHTTSQDTLEREWCNHKLLSSWTFLLCTNWERCNTVYMLDSLTANYCLLNGY